MTVLKETRPKKTVENVIKAEKIRIVRESDIQTAVFKAIAVSGDVGFKKTQQYMIATSVSELARNILRFAVQGEVLISPVEAGSKKGVRIIAKDKGPGITNIKLALTDHYSTFPGSLGVGLPGVKRMMDELEIISGHGTTVTAFKWIQI